VSLPVWLHDPALLPVWQQLRGPLERGNRTTRLTGLSRATRHALRPVLGRPVTGDVRVVLSELDEPLGRPLVEVVETLTGPLRDRAAERAARSAPLAVLAAEDEGWAAAVRSSGVLSRIADAEQVAQHAVAVRAQLPGAPRLRTQLAATVTGDAHALDDGRPLAAVVLRGINGGVLPATAAERRAVWTSVGVQADSVSSSVLTLGLRPRAGGPLLDAAERGDPVHLTPWDLERRDVRVDGPVLVVENPSVLEAFALRHGGRFALVCTAGWPAQVALDLLARLDTPLSYHGDLDWRGVEICSWLVDRRGVRPWRMTAQAYLQAPGGEPLTGRPAATPWEPQLAQVMAKRGVAVHEEQVVESLLADWPTDVERLRPSG
jgi:uncharacterized protein (TIGR02679 family)